MRLSFECPLNRIPGIMYSVLKTSAALSISPEHGEPVGVKAEAGGSVAVTCIHSTGAGLLSSLRSIFLLWPDWGCPDHLPRLLAWFPPEHLGHAEMLSTEGCGTFLLLRSAKPPAFYKHIKH